jgi:hypothetical protein
LSVEREKLASKKAEEEPTLALMAPAGTEKQKKKKAISVTKQIPKDNVDSILPAKKMSTMHGKKQKT